MSIDRGKLRADAQYILGREPVAEFDPVPAMGVEASTVVALLDELDQLKHENAGLRTGYQAYEQVNAGLKAQVNTLSEWYANSMIEREALRRDAERWKWLEGKADSATWENIGHQEQMNRHLHVDSAMSKDPLADKGQ